MKGTIKTTPDGSRVEIKENRKTYAVVFQLDENDERIKLYGKDKFMEGRMSLGEVKLLNY